MRAQSSLASCSSRGAAARPVAMRLGKANVRIAGMRVAAVQPFQVRGGGVCAVASTLQHHSKTFSAARIRPLALRCIW